jgi:hypothetical protein
MNIPKRIKRVQTRTIEDGTGVNRNIFEVRKTVAVAGLDRRTGSR